MNANVDSLLVGWQDELKKYEKERSRMSKKELKLKQECLLKFDCDRNLKM